MAQVRKFDKGTNKDGITALPDLFEWEGVGSYERKPMVQTLTKNLAGYADHLGLTGDRRNRFMTNGAAAIKALESGRMVKKADGSYMDATGVMSSTGNYDKNWLGKLKDTDNNAYNDIASYFDAYMNKATVYNADKVAKEAEEAAKKDKVKFGGDTFLKQQLAKSLYAGNFSEDDWFNHRTAEQRNKAIADVFNNADYADIYGKYLWDDTGIDSAEALRLKGVAFANEIANNKSDNLDYNTAAALGITQLKTFLEKPAEELAAPVDTPESRKKAAIQALIDLGYSTELAAEYYNLELAKQLRGREELLLGMRDEEALALADRAFSTWFTENSGKNRGINTSWINQTSKYYAHNDDALLAKVNSNYGGRLRDYYANNVSKALLGLTRYPEGVNLSEAALRSLRHAWNNDRDWFLRTYKDGEYIIPGTTMDYTAYVYNPSRNAYRQVDLLADLAYLNYVRQIWDALQKATSHKKGGILKFKDGGFYFDDTVNDTADDWVVRYNKLKSEKKEAVKQEALKSNRSPEQYTAGLQQIGTNFTTLEKIRLGTAAADVLSAISAFIPGYGTATSAVTGVGSTLTNFGVDMADKSVSLGLTFGNLGMGLGLDVVGLIPGLGAGAKAGKIARIFANIAPKAILAWGAIEGGGPAILAGRKLISDSNNMTVDDWRALSGGLQLLIGGARYGLGKRQLGKYTNKEKVSTIRTKSGKDVEISKEKLELMRKASGLDEQNRILESVAPGEKLSKEFKRVGLNIPGLGYNSGPATGTITRRSFVENTNPSMGRDEAWFRGLARIGEGTNANVKTPLWLKGWAETKNPNAPRTTTSRGAASSPEKPKRRIQALDADSPTRTIDRLLIDWAPNGDGSYTAVPGKVQNTRRVGKLTDAEIKQINNNRAARGQLPLTLQEIARINARAENNTYQAPSLKERVMASERYLRKSLEQDLARARQEMADANAAIAARENAKIPVPFNRAYANRGERVASGDPIRVAVPYVRSTPAGPLGLLEGYPTITALNRMLPAPRRIKIVNQPEPITADAINRNLGIRNTFDMGTPRSVRLAELDAVLGPVAKQDLANNIVSILTVPGKKINILQLIDSRLPKKPSSGAARTKKQLSLEKLLGPVQRKDNAKQTRARNKALKEADKPRRQAEFNERLKQREELRARRKTNRAINKAKKNNTLKNKEFQKINDEMLYLGTLPINKNGGTLIPKFQNPATGMPRPVTGVGRTTDNWYGNVGSLYIQNIIDGLSNNSFSYKDINGWLDDHYTISKDADLARPTYNEAVKSYLEGINKNGKFINDIGIAAGETNGRYKVSSNATSGDNSLAGWTADGYMSGKTADRMWLGKKGDYNDDLLKLARAKYNAAGYDLMLDKNGYYKLTHFVGQPSLNTKALAPAILDNSKSSGRVTTYDIGKPSSKSTTARAGSRTGSNKSGNTYALKPEDVLATTRMGMGLATNARAAALQKAGMRPLITDTWENVVSPEWDYFAQRAGENAYAGLTSFAGRARTANSQDQFAGQLEAENKGRQFIAQGNLLAANRFYTTDRLRLQESDAAKARRIENGNANTGRMLAVDAAKHQVDAALTTAQYALILAPWMAGIENEYRLSRAMLRLADATAFLRGTLAKYQDEYDKAIAAGNTAESLKVMNQYYKDVEDYNRTLYSNPWLITKTPRVTSSDFTFLAKEGGRLTAREKEVIQRARDFNKRMLADNKQFHKDIMESKREHNKLIAGMSSLTADLIKNGMKWK